MSYFPPAHEQAAFIDTPGSGGVYDQCDSDLTPLSAEGFWHPPIEVLIHKVFIIIQTRTCISFHPLILTYMNQVEWKPL